MVEIAEIKNRREKVKEQYKLDDTVEMSTESWFEVENLIDELEKLQQEFGKAMQLISDLDALLYDDFNGEAYKKIEKFLEGRDE